jgi:catechol-2,3-dioxygenase
LIGAPPALDEDTGPWRHVVWALPGGTLLGIHEHPGKTDASDSFSEYRIGLDHVAFGCASRADLVEWAARLDALGYAHGEIQDAGYGSGLSFRDPDGNALEFFAPPGS